MAQILVLGMLQFTEEYIIELKDTKAAQNLNSYPSTLRDYHRIQELKRMRKQQVVTISKNHCTHPLSPYHVEGNFHRRLAKSMKEKPLVNGPYNLIVGDYFFFPGEYLRLAYGRICDTYNGLLPALFKSGMLTSDVEIYLPLPPDKHDFPFGSESKEFTVSPIQACENPLVQATNNVPQSKLGTFTNKGQLALLDPKSPFIKLTLKPY